MENKNELKELDIKSRTCYYLDDITRAIDIYCCDILLYKKSYKKYRIVLINGISYKTCVGSIPLRIRFDKIDGFIKIYDRTIYLVILGHCSFHKICGSIKYLLSEKSGIADSINYNFARIRTDSYNSLPIEKILTSHNVIILIKSVVNKINNYYYDLLLEKGLYKYNSNTQYF